MKIKLAIILLCLLALSATTYVFAQFILPSLQSDDDNIPDAAELFIFDSAIHAIHPVPWRDDEISLGSFEDVLLNLMQNPRGAIIVGQVAGPSINRILDPAIHLRDFAFPSACNHVITPIQVNYIVSAGIDVGNLRIGEIVDVMELYYFVTSETQAFAEGIPIGDVRTLRSYIPMETGNLYLLFLIKETQPIFRHNGEAIFSAASWSSVHRLNSGLQYDATRPALTPYQRYWHQAISDMFGHLVDTPQPTP